MAILALAVPAGVMTGILVWGSVDDGLTAVFAGGLAGSVAARALNQLID
jgi:hypothetical protein